MSLARAFDYDAGEIAAAARSYRRGGPLPRPFYAAPQVFAADLDRIFGRYWLYACHACEVKNPGDWKTWAIGPWSIVVARGRDGELRAFHNTCRHRGARICNDEAGHSRLLVCPYHAWSYELDGRLRTPTAREFGIDQSELGLRPVKLVDVEGLLFVALGDDPVPFDHIAAEIAPKMAHQGLRAAKLATTIRYRVGANWKLVFENNRECYHCDSAHPEYVSGTYDTARFKPDMAAEVERETMAADRRFAAMGLDGAVASSAMTGRYWRATRAPLMAGWRTQSLDGAPVAPPMGSFRERGDWSAGTLRTTLFPNFWQHASDDHAVATRLTPIDAATTQVDVSWFVHEDAVEGRDYQLERLTPFWRRTSEQDWAICAANQAGVMSPAYEPGPYAVVMEANVQHFVDWYLDALTGERPVMAKAAE
jgi:Rieske 2Fe-2S family protein